MDRWAIRARLTPANRSSWRTQLLVILCICINLVVAQGSAGPSSRSSGSSSKPVSVSLNAKWSETPLYLETSEYLNEEGIHYFWSWIQALQDNQLVDVLPKQQPRQEYETIIKLARDLLNSPAKLSLLKFSLALRSHSPAIAMQHNMAMDVEGVPTQDCDAFAQLSYKPKNLSTVTSISSSQSGHTVENAIACDLSILKKLLNSLDDIVQSEGSSSLMHPIIYKNDHLYPAGSSQSAPLVVILYGEIGTSPFITMHNYLKELADAGRIRYVVRHFLRHNRGGKVSLSGYGVELAIKSTEYKAQDDTRVKGEETSQTVALKKEEIHKPEEVDGFLFSKLKSLYPEKAEKLDDLQNYLIDASKEIATLKVWELQELSLQAAKRILNSPKEEQLKVMRDLSQNFPVMARSLIKEKVDQELKRDIDINQQMFLSHLNLGPSDPALFVNGMYFDVDSMDVFGLLHILRQENRLVEGLHSLLDSAPDLNDRIDRLLRLGVAEDKSEGFQIDVRDSAVIYINDIENDKMYRNWPSGLHELLRPTYPGMLRNVRKNLYHLVLIIDPSKKESFDILKLAESFYVHKAPVRIGFVFAVNKDMSVDGFHDAGVAALNAFNFISQDKTPYEALSFLTDVIAAVSHNSPAKLRDLEPSDVIDLFKKKNPNEDYDLIFGQDSEYDTGRKLAWDFLTRTGLEGSVKALLNGVLLKESHLNADMFEEIVLTEIMKQTPAIQKAVYQGKIQDSDDILDWLMSQKTVMPRVNKRILGGSEEGDRFLDFSLSSTEHKDDPSKLSQDAIPALKENQLISILAAHVRYIDPRPDRCKPVSVWIVEDFESKEGRKLLSNGLNHLRENSDSMRIAPIYKNPGVVTRSIEAALQTLSGKELINFLTKLIDDENIHEKSDDQIVQLVVSSERETFKANLNRLKEDDKIFAIHQNFAKKALSIGKESSAVIINGKILEIPHDEALLVEDFNLIEKYVTSSYGDKVQTELKDVFENPYVCSDGVMKVSAVLLANPQGKTRHEIKYHSDSKGVINIPPADPSAPAIKIVAIVDPVSRGAQKLSPILMALQQVANSELKVFLNCVDKHSDMPLKSFYRFVIEYEPFFGDAHDDSNSYPQWMAYFSSLPSSPLLTLGMMVPENWLVESVRSPYDLDNIHLDEVDSQSGVWADFELEYLLLEGHCFEQSTGAPPRGLQFTLGTKTNPAQVDTIVMANLGYFQLKANPGAWQLKLRENTRSAEIYDIVSHENTDTPEGSSEVAALINSFRSRVIKIRVNKKPGKQHEELLDSSDEYGEDDDNSIWDSFSSWTGSSDATPKKKKTTEDGGEGDRLNIFSVASGHLYERLLRIMMISVLKHTKTPVKFWFLKNYLSPLFKDFLPYMAKHYGFEYELVQYKWPRWLHQQTEKQRIIWGYKILFLDVLFPLNVKKIIFVDADAIVRDDLKKLRDLDLEGAPYGYTPFCDSRKDMEGFRFWKSGYWASHLHGRKYHISALYVVDLQKFRRIAAGDRLRGQYQGLSQDPNSLSNLDQDLPNNMIHQVNIKSLPQEYLFCDTWCSQEDKKKAKVIDLCNNPMTKEPKLTAARRIAPEWQGYDDELKELMEKWRTERNKIASPLDSKPSISDQAQYQAEIPDHQEPLDTEPGQMHTEL